MLRITITLGRGRSPLVNVGKRGNVRPFFFGGGVTTGHTHTALRRGEEEREGGELWRRPSLVAKYAHVLCAARAQLSTCHDQGSNSAYTINRKAFPPFCKASGIVVAFSAIDKCDVVSIPPKACRSVGRSALCLPSRSLCPSLSTVPFLRGPGERLPGPTAPNSKSASLLHCTSSARFLRDSVQLGQPGPFP